MTEKRKPRIDYKFRQWSNAKTWALMALMVVVAVVGVLYYMTFRDNIRLTISESQAETKVDKQTDQFLPTLDSLIDMTKTANDKLELELRKPNEQLGTWEIYTFSAYTSQDEGVDNISSIGLDIGKYSMYFWPVAIAGDSYIEYGDTLLVRDFPGSTGITAFIALDTGGGLEVGKEDVPEIDVYFGNDLTEAFKFGEHRLEVWVIKN